MSRKSKYNWPELISAFHKSGLSQSQFCREQYLNPKYFNKKLNERQEKASSNFVPIKLSSVKTQYPDTDLLINVGNCTIRCSANMPLESVVTLVRSLA